MKKKDKDRDKPVQSVKNDRWDYELLDDLLREIRTFSDEHDKLHKTVENGPELWADAFWAMWKVNPKMENIEDMKISHMIDHTVIEAMEELDDYAKLHSYCRGDSAAAAQATISMRPKLEEIWDRTKKHQDLAKELEEKLQELQQLLQQQIQQAMQNAQSKSDDEDEDEQEGEGDEQGQGAGQGQQEQPQDGEGEDDEDESEDDPDIEPDENEQAKQNLQDRIDNVQNMIDELKKKMQEEQNSQLPNIRKQLAEGLSDALADAANLESMASLSYGNEKGSLQNMPVEERLKMAKELNNEKFRKVAKLLGPMKRYAESARRRKTNDSEEEIVDIDMGNDLSKVVPSEFAKFRHPQAKLLFMKDYFGEHLPEYRLDGVEPVGRGDIICAVDTSGSMQGEREIWGKAVALALLHLSRQQDRGFYAMNFSSRNQIKEYNFGMEVPFDVQKVIDFAGDVFWGGTDYVTPLDRALVRLNEEHKRTGKVNADVVFISDGECWIDDAWLAKFKAEQERLDFKVWGVLVGGTTATPALEQICDGKIISTADIVSGRDLDKIWQAM
jgi:uncharacterized protein with von Willebrand factor type A (vWA) domain